MRELFEKGNDLGSKLSMLKGYVQNEGVKYGREEKFNKWYERTFG